MNKKMLKDLHRDKGKNILVKNRGAKSIEQSRREDLLLIFRGGKLHHFHHFPPLALAHV